MTLRRFIQIHRPEIDKVIRKYNREQRAMWAPEPIRLNDYTRRLFVLGDDALRLKARDHGVPI